jgi:hypothetical protein
LLFIGLDDEPIYDPFDSISFGSSQFQSTQYPSSQFQPSQISQIRSSTQQKQNGSVKIDKPKKQKPFKLVKPKLSKIYYTSRTHSQISQLVSELRSTVYKPSMSILASRAHMCINPKVKDSEDRNDACSKLLEFNECRYHHGVQRVNIYNICSINYKAAS